MPLFQTHLPHQTYSLESFKKTYVPELKKAAEKESLWALVKKQSQPLEDFIESLFADMEKAHIEGSQFAYVVKKNDSGQICGSCRYYDISALDKRLTIGFTWYHPDLWGSGINAQVKYCLLRQVFETLNWNRVSFHVDSRNKRSIGAMKKLGAQQEGTLRKHKIVQGDYVRDTVLFSIIKSNWESIKETLNARINRA
jgi:N-acetyltransferase